MKPQQAEGRAMAPKSSIYPQAPKRNLFEFRKFPFNLRQSLKDAKKDTGLNQSIATLQAENAQLKKELEEAHALIGQAAAEAAKTNPRSNLLEAILDTIPIGVVVADAPSGRIVMGNRHAEEMVRHPILESADVDSYGEWISYHEDGCRVQSHEYPLSRVIRDGEDRSELDVHYQRGDGTRFWMRIVCHPVYDADGSLNGAIVALIDIDNERQLVAQQEVLIAELNHRVKNAFTVVKSIVSQSLRGEDATAEIRDTIDQRLNAYAKAHSQLIGSQWDCANLKDIAEDTIGGICGGRITMEGPDIVVPSRVAMSLSMAFYELATNAFKHGSLSVPEGHVRLNWCYLAPDHKTIRIEWVELLGPVPIVPKKHGFGSKIINHILAAETNGAVDISYPTEGLRWSIELPVGEQE